MALLEGSSPDDVVFLQLKQARRSVLARYVHGDSAWHAHQGQRVVEYQQALQTVSDPLLGWTTVGERQYYVRQFRNMKGTIPLDAIDAAALADYAGIVGHLLAKGHARTSGASMIAGYAGGVGQAGPGAGPVRPSLRRPDRGRPRHIGEGGASGSSSRYGGCVGAGRFGLSSLKSARLPDRQRERPGRQSTPRPTTARAPMQKCADAGVREAASHDPVGIGGSLLPIGCSIERWPGIPEHCRRDAGWQVAAAQRGDEPVDGPVAFALDSLDCEDHPGAADVRIQATGVLVMSGRHDLFAVNRALVHPIDREANVGASGVATSDDFLADDCASKDGIGFPQCAIGRNSSTAAGEGFRRVDDRRAGAQQQRLPTGRPGAA